ncbi:O-antigen ligase family protein, partial [Chamaesiphon sp. VAR_48_metabat_135_sub]|uniref:O-antigen ligase family protein n=1 Tax=Chamaesiphon sp. VAR_48_metabat_135_sub TaxID=2964699 RepID=UPI00286B647A
MIAEHKISKTEHPLFYLSLIVLPFFSPLSLVGFLFFSIKTIFDRHIYLNTYLKSVAVPSVLAISAIFVSSCLTAYNKAEAFTVLFNFLPFFLLFLAGAKIFTPKNLEQALTCILISSIPVIILAIIEFTFNQYGWYSTDRLIFPNVGIRYPRSSAVFENSNGLASYLVTSLGISLGMLIKYSQYRNKQNACQIRGSFTDSQLILLIKTYICSNLLALTCTQSRNAFLAAIVLIFITIIISKFRNLNFFSSLLVFTVIGFCLLKNITLMRYINGEISLTASMSREILTFATDSRTKIWKFAILLGNQRLFLGWGLGNYKLLYPVQSIGTPPHPHNLWLMLFAETGIMGLASLNIFVGSILYQAVRKIHSIEKEKQYVLISYLMAFLASIMFHCFDCPLFDARINCI